VGSSVKAKWFMTSVFLTLATGSCASTFYEGPRELLGTDAPRVESEGTIVDEIDGQDLRPLRLDTARFVLPPGPHVIGFSLLESRVISTPDEKAPSHFRVCVATQPGHTYWTAAEPVTKTSGEPEPGVVSPRGTRRTTRAKSWLPVVFERADRSAPGGGAGRGRASLGCENERLFAAAGSGGEGVSAAPELERSWSGSAITRYDPLPLLDLILGFGVATGWGINRPSEVHASNELLSFGDGLFLSLGALVTPLWIGGRVGLGGGVEVGFKYDAPALGSDTLTRYPASLTGHALFRVSRRGFVVVAGGASRDFAVNLTSYEAMQSGLALTSHVGELARVLFYYRIGDRSAFMLGLMRTFLTYSVGGMDVDAGSLGHFVGVSFAL